ncbi:squalene synthase [Tanacetum coccineum]
MCLCVTANVDLILSNQFSSYQKVIKDIAMKMGIGMAKLILNEVETINNYDEYCHYAAGLVGIGLSKLLHASGKEISLPDPISNSIGLFLQKANIIRDFHKDINEVPKPLIFWPRKIWNKYVDRFEDLRHKDNSEKAFECLNDMVTNTLIHIEDCLEYMSDLHDPAIFRFCAIPHSGQLESLAFCYNMIKFLGGVVQNETCKDPNAKTTFRRIEAVQKKCRDLGTIDKRESYIAIDEPSNDPTLVRVALLIVILAILYAYLRPNRPT